MKTQTLFASLSARAPFVAAASLACTLAFAAAAQAAPDATPAAASTWVLTSHSNPAKVRYSIVRIDKFSATETPALLNRIAAANGDVELHSYPFISAKGPSTYVVIGSAQPGKTLTVVNEVAKVGLPQSQMALRD